MKKISPHKLEHRSNEVIVYACIRNEFDRLPYFISYYKNLGIQKFVFIDNNSNDGSTEYLLSRDDSHVFWTDQSYSESRCGINWTNELLNRFSLNKWVLVVDADELLVYPGCEDNNINNLILYLDNNKASALQTFLLDMYANAPLKEAKYTRGQPFLDTAPFFDIDSYEYPSNDKSKLPIRGGVRKRLFWRPENNHRGKPPVLTKMPLIKWSNTFSLEASTHVLKNAKYSKMSGVLLHFKLFSDFYSKAKIEFERAEHWDQAAQYEAYWNTLKDNPRLNPFYKGSQKYFNSRTLINFGMMKTG